MILCPLDLVEALSLQFWRSEIRNSDFAQKHFAADRDLNELQSMRVAKALSYIKMPEWLISPTTQPVA